MTKNVKEHPLTSSSCFADNEIDLISLFRILMRRKMTMFLTFISTFVVAVVYLLLAEPVYESKVVVQVGRVGQGQYVEDVNGIRRRLLSEHPELSSVAVDTSKLAAINIFTLTLRNNDRTQAEQKLLKIAEKLLKDHNAVFDKAIGPIKQRIDFLQKQSREYQNRIGALDDLIERLKSKEPTQATMLVIERSRLSSDINALEERMVYLQQSLIEPYSVPTRLLGAQTTPKTPVKPKVMLVITLSIFLGLMLSVFSAFFAEIVVRAGESESEKKKN